mgnify:CR=1 FL=1
MLLLANGNGPFVSIKKRIRKGIIKKIKALALEWFFLENCFSFLWDRKPKPFKGWCSQENGPHSSLSTALRDNGTPAARPPLQSKVFLSSTLSPSPSPPPKQNPPRALLPLGASEAYRCATRAPEHTAPENGDTFLIEKNGRIEETAGVRGDSHGQAARRTSLFPHSSRTD